MLDAGFFTMNVDKGTQSNSGPHGTLAGNMANGQECGTVTQSYVQLNRIMAHAVDQTSDSSGRLWLLVGTDSGFGGPTQLYYQRVAATLTPR